MCSFNVTLQIYSTTYSSWQRMQMIKVYIWINRNISFLLVYLKKDWFARQVQFYELWSEIILDVSKILFTVFFFFCSHRSSLLGPTHTRPPCRGDGLLQERWRSSKPVPQVVLHCPQDDQGVQPPFLWQQTHGQVLGDHNVTAAQKLNYSPVLKHFFSLCVPLFFFFLKGVIPC